MVYQLCKEKIGGFRGDSMIDDLYKNCCWCRWFKDGQCLHDKTFRSVSIDIRHLAEEGIISEEINEGFTEQDFKSLESNLENSLSKKKAKEFTQAFYEELEAIKATWTESIGEAVTMALQSAIDERAAESAEVTEPN